MSIYVTVEDVIETVEGLIKDTGRDNEGRARTASEAIGTIQFNNHIRHVIRKLNNKYIPIYLRED